MVWQWLRPQLGPEATARWLVAMIALNIVFIATLSYRLSAVLTRPAEKASWPPFTPPEFLAHASEALKL